MKIGDAILTPDKPPCEGYVTGFDRYGQKGTVCVYINFRGDGMYIDYDPRVLTITSIDLIENVCIKRQCLELRQRNKRKSDN